MILLVLSQVILSMQLSFAVIPLIMCRGKPRLSASGVYFGLAAGSFDAAEHSIAPTVREL